MEKLLLVPVADVSSASPSHRHLHRPQTEGWVEDVPSGSGHKQRRKTTFKLSQSVLMERRRRDRKLSTKPSLTARSKPCRSFLTSSSSSSSLGAAGGLAGGGICKNGSSPFSSQTPPVRLKEQQRGRITRLVCSHRDRLTPAEVQVQQTLATLDSLCRCLST